MASTSASIKDIIKSLNNALSTSRASDNLPASLEQQIYSTIGSQGHVDENDAQKLHDDLLNTYHKLVAGKQERVGLFLQALVLLEPSVTGLSRKFEWWKTVIKPVLDGVDKRKIEIERASEWVENVLNYDAEDDTNSFRTKQAGHFTKLLLESYLAHARVDDNEAQEYSLEDEHVASQYENILINFGKHKAEDLLIAVDALILQPKHRQPGLALLSTFLAGQPPHLDLVSKTSLIEHLLQCLMIDTSNTVIQIALTVLVMFLPHVPSSIKTHLPRLFLIYSRLLCWDQVEQRRADDATALPTDNGGPPEEEPLPSYVDQADAGWAKLEGFYNEDAVPLDVSYYFTFLYGLYPMNFTSYVKKPRRYLKNINFPRADQLQLDQDLIMTRTEPFRGMHLLHPNFYNTTAEEELEDDRWLKIDAADVVAECIGLRVSLLSSGPPPGAPPKSKLPDIPTDVKPRSVTKGEERLASGSIHSSSASGTYGTPESKSIKRPPSRPSRPPIALDGGESPTLPPISLSESSRRSSESTGRASSSLLATIDPTKALLQQQLALVRNDLKYERYLKHQHLQHIGELQRRHIADATAAANTENLINTNKSLRSKITKANDAYTALKKETVTGRTQSKRFESDLSSKVRSLRDAERAWRAEEATIRSELEKARSDSDALRKIVVEAEAREMLAGQKLASTELKSEQNHSLTVRIQDLEEQIRIYEGKDMEYSRNLNKVETLQIELDTMAIYMKGKDEDLRRQQEQYNTYIEDLEGQLADATRARDAVESEGLSPERRMKVEDAIRRAVGTANARTDVARKEKAALRHGYAELEMRCKELENELDRLRPEATGRVGSTPRNIPAPRRAGTAPVAIGSHWRNSSGTPTDTDEGSASSPTRPLRPDQAYRYEPTMGSLRRTSRGLSNTLSASTISENQGSPTLPIVGPASAPSKQPPLPAGTALASPQKTSFSSSSAAATTAHLQEYESTATGTSAPTGSGSGGGLYMNKKSAWSMDSLDSGQTGESGKTKVSGRSGRSGVSSFLSGKGGKTEGEAEEERRRKEAKRRQPPKQGGLRGLKGLI